MSNHRFVSATTVIEYIKMALSASGFKRGSDYTITGSQVFFRTDMNFVKKNKVMSALTTNFPQYSFVWESSRMLKWN